VKTLWVSLIVIGLGLAAAAAFALHRHLQPAATGPVAHVENGFAFTVRGPYDTVAPLFGAWAERAWGGEHWNPVFLHPQPAQDQPGEVFTVDHGHANSVWVNTALDFKSGHVQYVYVVPDAQAVLIDIHLQPKDAASTGVAVVYQRTALRPEFNARVTELGQHDRNSGKEWETAIEAFLQTSIAH
jgi:hypothetical protein